MTSEQKPTGIGELDQQGLENPTPRSIFDFSDTELENVVSTGSMPDGTTLVGIENQENFESLWRFRSNASKLASAILRKRLGRKLSKEPNTLKEQRFELKRLELELKAKKQESAMFYQKVILDKLDLLELKLKAIQREIETLSKTLVRTD